MNIYKKQVGTTLFIALLFAVMFGCTNSKVNNAKDKNESVTFGICTDVHHNVIHDAPRRLGIFVDDMIDKKADFVIEMGDFCYPDSTSNNFMEVFNRFKNDKYFVLGNHDRDNGVTREQSINYFGMPAAYYSFDKNGFHFIVLNGNEFADTTKNSYPRNISDKQIGWLKNDLAKTDRKTVVFVHQSLFDSHGVINQDTVRSVLAEPLTKDGKHKVLACFNGHSHIDAATKIDGIWYVAINSMSYFWIGGAHKHKSYSDAVHKKNPWIEYVCPYKEPLYAFVTINKNGTVLIKGRKTEWVGPSPESYNFKSEYYRPEWITPQVSDRTLK
jgi:3',5'-cyclic AMP phosphodiesterase CpdA